MSTAPRATNSVREPAAAASAIRGVLFDVDDTLLDTTASMRSAARAAFVGGGAELAARGAELWLADRHDRYLSYLAGQLSHAEQRVRRVVDLYEALGRTAPSVAEIEGWLARYRAAQLTATAVYADVSAALADCAALPLGLLTNNDSGWQRQRLARVGLEHHFGPVLGVEDVGAAKPDPAIFQAGRAALGLPPEQVAYVGDDLNRDARGARDAGLTGIWLDRPGDETPDRTAVTLDRTAAAPHRTAVAPPPADVPRITTLAQLATRLGIGKVVR